MFCEKTFQDNSETQSLMRGDVEDNGKESKTQPWSYQHFKMDEEQPIKPGAARIRETGDAEYRCVRSVERRRLPGMISQMSQSFTY